MRVDRVRLGALLSIAFNEVCGASTLRLLEFAEAAYKQGHAAKSAMHVALANFPKFVSRAHALRLHTAAGLLDAGLFTSRDLVKVCGLDVGAFDAVTKYNPNEPRVPAGNGGGPVDLLGPSANGGRTPAGDQVAVKTNNFNYACRVMRLDRNVASEILHGLKDAANLSGADQCTFDTDTGDVFYGDEYIGNLHDQ